MSFFNDLTAEKVLGLVFLVAGAIMGFLCNKLAVLSYPEDSNKKYRLSWIYKAAGLAFVVVAFIIILNS